MTCLVSTTPRRTRALPRLLAGRVVPTLREVALLGVLLLIYQVARLLGGHDVSAAFAHADGILRLQTWLHLPSEQTFQAALLPFTWLIQVSNAFYASAHLPVTALALLWLMVRRPQIYRRTRRALFAATGTALIVFLLLPVAPPRMMPGFVDTAAQFGQSVYSGSTLTNQYAALPSLHVGWAVLVACALISATRTPWRWLWLLHPAMTLFVVIVTGNHYWIDAVIGALLVLLAFAAPVRQRAAGPAGPAPEQLPAVSLLTATPAVAPTAP